MISTRITLSAFATLAVVSTLVAKLQNIVHVSNDPSTEPQYSRYIGDDPLTPDDGYHHVMWFLQISDLHLSVFKEDNRGHDFKRFCNETVKVIKPSVVLATGDLVDAIMPDHLGSRQYVEEWLIYKQALYETGVTKNTVWLDIRGNHDNFNVFTIDEKNNFYRKYSVQGAKNRRSYSYHLQKDSNKYTFIGIDACMEPGPKRPFNFLGVVKQDEFSLLKQFLNESRGNNMTIWFGHYPTSTIVSPSPGVRELMRTSGPYLCGHLHTLGGLVPEMYTLQSTGSLELELADWKKNKKYRLAAVDYGMFTFIDEYLGDWPIILVTNPKDALLTMPVIEPLHRMGNSTHVRILMFSSHNIIEARLKIDDSEWQPLRHVKGPLFVLKWEPSKYKEGLHQMVVYARDKNGSEKSLNHQFSLDGTRPTFPLRARFVLMGHISIGQVLFSGTLMFTLLPLCLLRVCLCLNKGKAIVVKSESNFMCRFVFKLYLLTSFDRVFWPIIIAAMYVALGPWFIGFMIDGHIGICFVWGIFIGGHFLPGGLTFVAGMTYLLTFYIPLILCLSCYLYHHCRTVMEGDVDTCSLLSYICRHSIMMVFISWETVWAIVVFYSYGTMAFLLGFTFTWSIILALILWRLAITIPEAEIIKKGVWEKRQVAGTPLLPGYRVDRQISGPSHDGVIPS